MPIHFSHITRALIFDQYFNILFLTLLSTPASLLHLLTFFLHLTFILFIVVFMPTFNFFGGGMIWIKVAVNHSVLTAFQAYVHCLVPTLCFKMFPVSSLLCCYSKPAPTLVSENIFFVYFKFLNTIWKQLILVPLLALFKVFFVQL